MKIKKKNTTIPINGKIVDTENVEDKTSNAPSMRLVEEMMNVETMTNENGTAIKFPDGTMICSIIKDFTTDDTYGAFSWNFPQNFINKPAVTMLPGRPSNSSVITNNINNLSTSGVQFIIRRIYNNLQSNNLVAGSAPNLTLIDTCLTAVGRWK